jgi:hypothetical protein
MGEVDRRLARLGIELAYTGRAGREDALFSVEKLLEGGLEKMMVGGLPPLDILC